MSLHSGSSRTWHLTILVVAVALTGCFGDDDPVDVPEAPRAPPLTAPSFGEAVAMEQTFGSAEPNIAVLPDGTLFMAAPVGGSPKPNTVEGAAYLWRSQDDGATWETLRSPDLVPDTSSPGAFCSCDADVVTSPDGWVYYTDWWIAGLVGPGNYLVEASSDGGETWSANPAPIPDHLLASMDRQWLVAGPDGFVGLFWSNFGDNPVLFGGHELRAAFSNDHGETWSTPVPVRPSESGWNWQIAHPFLLGDGTIVMPYGAVQSGGDFWTDPSEVRFAFSRDGGATWDHEVVADVPGGFDALWAVQGTAVGTAGMQFAWSERTGENTVLWTRSMTDAGDAFTGKPARALASTGNHFLPWLASQGPNITVGWYGGPAPGDPEHALDTDAWFAYAAHSRDGGQAWTTGRVSDEPVKTGPMCPRGASCGGDRELLDYVSMVYTPDGAVQYAFAREVGGDATVFTARTVS